MAIAFWLMGLTGLCPLISGELAVRCKVDFEAPSYHEKNPLFIRFTYADISADGKLPLFSIKCIPLRLITIHQPFRYELLIFFFTHYLKCYNVFLFIMENEIR